MNFLVQLDRNKVRRSDLYLCMQVKIKHQPKRDYPEEAKTRRN